MAELRIDPISDALDKLWMDNQGDNRRDHLGASVLGNPCTRALWYGFRWATTIKHGGRLLRLFDRGQREEQFIVAQLRRIGIDVMDRDPNTGRQWSYSAIGGHVGGSADALAVGVPQSPTKPHVLEFKTSGTKQFDDLLKRGCEGSKPLHYVQQQCYMHWQGFERSLYVVVCKEDDRVYSERIKYVPEVARAAENKAAVIVRASEPLPKLSEDASYYACKFCDHYSGCHQQAVAAVSCRTCISATPELDGNARWSCAHIGRDLTPHQQRQGCPAHRLIPSLVPHSDCIGGDLESRRIDYKVRQTGIAYSNGTPGPMSFASDELSAIDPRLIGDPGIEALRESGEFHGRVISSTEWPTADQQARMK
jgi:hypothetical protein